MEWNLKLDKKVAFNVGYGAGFTSPWVWLSSCDLTSNISGKRLDNSVFDIGVGKLDEILKKKIEFGLMSCELIR